MKLVRRTVMLREDEYEALIILAERERRGFRDQAAWLIRDGLERLVLLPLTEENVIEGEE